MFQTKSGVTFRGLSPHDHAALIAELGSTYALRSAQIVEAAAYSFTMVVRYALGLSAQGGNVIALASESLSGWVTLATARQLSNAGAHLHVLLLLDPEQTSPETEAQVDTLQRMGVTVEHWSFRSDAQHLAELVGNAHNVLCGLYDYPSDLQQVVRSYSEILNESSTPVHCIACPPGINAADGSSEPTALIASSTLSLGAPLLGLWQGRENVGRHYLADISCPSALYEQFSLPLQSVFAEQPVTQITAMEPTSE